MIERIRVERIGVERSEQRLFFWSLAGLFWLGWADVSLRNVAETLFLKRVGVAHLPLVFLANSILLVGSTWVVSQIVARTRDRIRLVPLTLAGLALLLLPLWLFIESDAPSTFGLLVVASKQVSALALLVFFVALGDLLDARQAKRLFAPLAGGFTLGTIVGSFASEPLGHSLGVSGLLPVALVALCLSAGVTLRLVRHASGLPVSLAPAPDPTHVGRVRARSLWRESALFRLLFATALCSGVVAPMLYFEFSYVADAATQGVEAEQQLLRLYARFRGWIHIAVLVVQLGLAARIYRWIGTPVAAALSPLVYLCGFAGLSATGSLPVAIAAMSSAKLQDNAVYDPALRALLDLLSERQRARAMALLEGPVKRLGGALGNLLVIVALSGGAAMWVGWLALPICVLWMGVAFALWRFYPSLLLQAAESTGLREEGVRVERIDRATLRQLEHRLLDPSAERCRSAIEIIGLGPPQVAARALWNAVREAPSDTRSMLVAALDRLIMAAPGAVAVDRGVSRGIAQRLAHGEDLGDVERAQLVRAYARLRPDAIDTERDPVLARAQIDSSSAVRLVASAAHLRASGPGQDELVRLLGDAVTSQDPALRANAREELRALLLELDAGSQADPLFEPLLLALTQLLDREDDRPEVAEALVDVARRHRGAVQLVAAEPMLEQRENSDPRVRAAVLRFVGWAGLREHASWLVSQLVSDADATPMMRHAAREGLRGLGVDATESLLAELSFGHRRSRDAVLPLVRELPGAADALRSAYERELDSLRFKLVQLGVLQRGDVREAVLQRLRERVDEGVHTVLHLLASLHRDPRIRTAARQLRRPHSERRHAVLVEALEALLPRVDRERLIPLLDASSSPRLAWRAARSLGITLPSPEHAARGLQDDPDRLTRELARATQGTLDDRAAMPETGRVQSHIERALLLKRVSPFESLTTRQLVHLAERMVEEAYEPETTVVQEGAPVSAVYLIVGGGVTIHRSGSAIGELGPGDFFGEVAIFDSECPSVALESKSSGVRLLSLARDQLIEAMEDLPEIGIRVCEALSRRLLGPARDASA